MLGYSRRHLHFSPSNGSFDEACGNSMAHQRWKDGGFATSKSGARYEMSGISIHLGVRFSKGCIHSPSLHEINLPHYVRKQRTIFPSASSTA